MGSDILLLVSGCDEDAASLQAAAEEACTVVVAADPGQCLQLLGQAPHLIVVSDRVDDLAAVCAAIKKEPFGASPPIVLLAAPGASPDTADVDGVMTRPPDAAVVAAWLQAAQRIGQLRRTPQTCGSTDEKNCEQLLRSFARLSHAVNNPLQALYATIDMLMLNHALTPEATTLASEAISHASRVAKLVGEASTEAKQALQAVAPERPTQVT